MNTHLLRRFISVATLATITTSLLFIQSAPVSAGTDNRPSPKLELAQVDPFQYIVKFMCGKSDGTIIAPGAYYTVINVHNPNAKFTFSKWITIPGTTPETGGKVGKPAKPTLDKDQSLESDCRDIVQLSPAKADFLEGFVVIQSNFELDVVAVYTVLGPGQGVAMEIERVPARRVG